MRRRRAILAGAALVASGATAGAGARMRGIDTGDRQPQAESDPFSVQAVDADRTRIRIDLGADGNAGWQVAFWTRLEDEETTAAFESVEADIADDPAPFLDRFEERIGTTVAAARETTGREMAADDFAVSTDRRTIPEEYGLLVYTFRWSGFAAVEGSDIVAGDAIDGFLLEEGTRLTLHWPEDYDLVTASPDPDDRSDPNRLVVWFGSETEFLPGEPRLRVSTAAEGIPTWFAAGTVAALLLLIGVTFYVFGREPDREGDTAGRTAGTKPFERENRPSSEVGTVERGDAATGEPRGEETAPNTDRDSDAATAAGTDGDSASHPSEGETASPDDDEPPEELLTNEERVLRLLEENGGRMKQQAIADELEWTDAKTSKVVTGLREEDRIDVYRIGRENVVALPGETDL